MPPPPSVLTLQTAWLYQVLLNLLQLILCAAFYQLFRLIKRSNKASPRSRYLSYFQSYFLFPLPNRSVDLIKLFINGVECLTVFFSWFWSVWSLHCRHWVVNDPNFPLRERTWVGSNKYLCCVSWYFPKELSNLVFISLFCIHCVIILMSTILETVQYVPNSFLEASYLSLC